MQLIKTMINHVFIPILTLLFLCSGLLAAVTSATIEYSVFISLFTSVQQTFISPSLLALLFVIPLEYTKIFSHYLNGKLHEASPSFSKHFTRKVGVLILIPTLISLACSIIFSINALDLASYSSDSVNAQIAEITQSCEEDISQKQQSLAMEKSQRIAPYQASKETAFENLNSFTSSNLTSSLAKQKLAFLQDSASLTASEYAEREQEFEKDFQQKLHEYQTEREAQRDRDLAALTDLSDASVASQYDNPLLAHTLTVLFQTLFAHRSYPRSCYLVISIVISLALSIFLELFISFSQEFIAQPLDFLAPAPDPSLTEKTRRWCNDCILLFIKAICGITLYITIMFFAQKAIATNTIYRGILSYMLTYWLINRLPSLIKKPSDNNNALYSDIYYTARECLLQGVVAFGFYLLLGFLFGETAVNISVSTVAIGMGSFLAATLNRIPQELLKFQSNP